MVGGSTLSSQKGELSQGITGDSQGIAGHFDFSSSCILLLGFLGLLILQRCWMIQAATYRFPKSVFPFSIFKYFFYLEAFLSFSWPWRNTICGAVCDATIFAFQLKGGLRGAFSDVVYERSRGKGEHQRAWVRAWVWGVFGGHTPFRFRFAPFN